jgi:hypothetical protein
MSPLPSSRVAARLSLNIFTISELQWKQLRLSLPCRGRNQRGMRLCRYHNISSCALSPELVTPCLVSLVRQSCIEKKDRQRRRLLSTAREMGKVHAASKPAFGGMEIISVEIGQYQVETHLRSSSPKHRCNRAGYFHRVGY